MIKLLIGGSPCTHWSIAQSKNREATPSGLGWELFLNFIIVRDKYQPDYFLYENNKSMAPAIKAEITKQFGFEPVLINSALVSAQSRWRLYWAGKRNPDGSYSRVDVSQPDDRGILLRDILESGMAWQEKGYTLTTRYMGSIPSYACACAAHPMAAEPIRIGTIESDCKNPDCDSQQYRAYSPDGKSATLCGSGGGARAKTGLYAVPVEYSPLPSCDVVITAQNIRCTYKDGTGTAQGYSVYFDDVKSPAVIAGHAHKMKIIEPCVVWSENGLVATAKINNKLRAFPIYTVVNSHITIKDKTYPIKLPDGHYIIRKLTVTECKRLQTVPDSYFFPISNTRAYTCLGNGWTVDVITHIMSHFDGITTEPVEVLSMYDGMSCGNIALDKLGANVVRYYATEIDPYAIKATQHNYPGTIQLGDAFQVREKGWKLP